MKNYHNYLRAEEIDWFWSFDQKTKTHKLILTHRPTKKFVTGEFIEKRGMKLSEKKHELKEQLHDELEDLVLE